MKPLAFVYNWVPGYRRGFFELLAEREAARYLLFGGRTLHPQRLDEQLRDLDAPAEIVSQSGVHAALRRDDYRAVVASTNGRVALPAAYLAARRMGVPFVLWATMWRHPRTAAHALSRLPMGWIYRHADAVVTYGPHVSRYVGRFRDGRDVFEAPQAMDNEGFGAPVDPAELERVRAEAGGRRIVLFVGRMVEAKGVRILAEAWRELTATATGAGDRAVLVAIGDGPLAGELEGLARCVLPGRLAHDDLRPWYAAAEVTVLPSIPTRAFLEPWGYVVNESFLHATPVIATDAVGAAAGGLVEDGVNGWVVPADEAGSLARAIQAALDNSELCARLGVEGRMKVLADYTHASQAAGFERALAACGVSLCAS